MPFPEAFLQELEEKNPIEDVVGQYVSLTRRGSNLFGLCPFHNEKTPSFSVAPEKGIFYCFGCHKGGGAVNFIMEIEGLDYPDAIRFLAKRAGMEVPNSNENADSRKRRERLFQLNKEAARYFYSNLSHPDAQQATAYLLRRGLSRRTVTNFGMGYALNSWDALIRTMTEKGYSKREMLDAGLAVESQKGSIYDRFRGRVMFPIIDVRGNVIGFGGRVLDDSTPKYLNSPDTPIYNKSKNLFALNLAKRSKAGRLILTEGYMDTIALHQAGFDCAVASLGTSLTEDHARLISRYTKEVILAYDGDAAGVNAAQRAIPILDKTGLQVRVLQMQGAKDPDEFIRKFGREAFQRLLDGSENQMEYRLAQLRNKFHLEDPADRVSYLQEAAAMIAKLDSPVEREIYGGRAAETAGIERDTMLAEISNQRRKGRWKQRKQQQRKALQPAMEVQPKERQLRYQDVRSAKAEEGLIGLVMADPTLFQDMDGLQPEDFSAPALGNLYRQAKTLWETTGSITLSAMAQGLSGAEMNLLASLMQKPQMLGEARQAIADYSRQIRTQKWKREMTKDRDILSFAIEKNGRNPNE